MNDRTKQLEAVFHAASELTSPEELESFLNEACRGDAALRHEVEALLKAAVMGEERFRPVEQASARFSNLSSEPVTECAGAMIGRYKLLERIGEGGMGVVYMAEQEQPVRRKVALKIIKLGMDTRQVVARFEAERQALAMMDHPNIARVLDGGATDAGRPFFVMELVQGVRITEFCAANHLSIQQGLQLFIPVCQAIQSAHQKGIIHRDIKPSNVLVTMHNGRPHPMVIDFGVAKAIDQKLTEQTLFTHFATMIGTPAYMSPEQAEMSKLDVDTRSDIYSLGVLLYELLTGTTPFPEKRLRSVAYGEMQRIILDEEPERPSTRLRKKAGGSIAPLVTRHWSLATDLDWIVMKCLEKDRNRRYDTADALVADIQAHLQDEPVVARPPSAAYRVRKFVRRNRARVAAGAFALLVLVAAAVVSSLQAVRATRAERSSRAVKDFLVDQVLAANPYVDSQSDPSRRLLLERVARAVEIKFKDQPLIEAELRMVLAGGLAAVGDRSNALVHCERALETRRRELGPTHSDTLWSLAWVGQAQILYVQKTDLADLLRETAAAVRKTRRPWSSGEAEIVWTYGFFLSAVEKRPAEALPYLHQAVSASKRLSDPSDYRLHNKLDWVAEVTEDAGRFDEADRLWSESIENAEHQMTPDHVSVAKFKKSRAGFLLRRQRAHEALPLIASALQIYERVLGTNHPATVHAQKLLREISAAAETTAVKQDAPVTIDSGPRLSPK